VLLQVHGGSAQDYVSLPNWETYGWAAFFVDAKPSGSPATKALLEVSHTAYDWMPDATALSVTVSAMLSIGCLACDTALPVHLEGSRLCSPAIKTSSSSSADLFGPFGGAVRCTSQCGHLDPTPRTTKHHCVVC
jgi:hypothetical protein